MRPVRKSDNLPPLCADVKKSGGLNLLETCGPVQACNGTAAIATWLLRRLASHSIFPLSVQGRANNKPPLALSLNQIIPLRTLHILICFSDRSS
jgi:hypothetical protein